MLRLEKARAAAMTAADFGLSDEEGEGSSSEEEEEEEEETMGAAAEVCACRSGLGWLPVKGHPPGPPAARPASARARHRCRRGPGPPAARPASARARDRCRRGPGPPLHHCTSLLARPPAPQAAKKGRRGGAVTEAVTKDLGALSSEQKEAALMADAPELLALLSDLQVRAGRVGAGCGLRRCWWSRLCAARVVLAAPPAQPHAGARLHGRSCRTTATPPPPPPTTHRRLAWPRCATAWVRCWRRCAPAGWPPRRACLTWRPSTCCCSTTASPSPSTSCSRRRGAV